MGLKPSRGHSATDKTHASAGLLFRLHCNEITGALQSLNIVACYYFSLILEVKD